jgi:hypothetical protein
MRIASFHRILLRATPLLLVACASHGPSPQPQPRTGLTLLQCPRTHPAAAEAAVDEKGDRITVRGHTFELRPGSVRRITPFRVRDRPDGYAGVEIEPDRTQFDVPARLTLSYAQCAAEAAGFSNLEIVQVQTGGTVIVDSTLNSEWNRNDMTVSVDIGHLSGYLIAGT